MSSGGSERGYVWVAIPQCCSRVAAQNFGLCSVTLPVSQGDRGVCLTTLPRSAVVQRYPWRRASRWPARSVSQRVKDCSTTRRGSLS